MAAEKLTTGRLVQILVVMTVLIAAFIWRTVEYTKPENATVCAMVENVCAVSVNEETIEIRLDKQSDSFMRLVVKSLSQPGELHIKNGHDIIVPPEKTDQYQGEKRTYIYALPQSVNISPAHNWSLSIDQDQVEINF